MEFKVDRVYSCRSCVVFLGVCLFIVSVVRGFRVEILGYVLCFWVVWFRVVVRGGRVGIVMMGVILLREGVY